MATGPEAKRSQKMQPELESVPSRLGQEKPALRGIFNTLLSGNFFFKNAPKEWNGSSIEDGADTSQEGIEIQGFLEKTVDEYIVDLGSDLILLVDAGNGDDGQEEPVLDDLHHVDAVFLRQQQVGDDQVGELLAGQLQRLLPILGDQHIEPVIFQEFLQQQTDILFVIND